MDTLAIRSAVLRNGHPEEECVFDGDKNEQTFHLGAFIEGRLVSIASFYYDRSSQIESETQYRLRGMATIENYRGKGLSTELLEMAFPIIKQNFCDIVWCNARIAALGFYENVGFTQKGEVFNIEGIGDHKLMFKKTV